MKKLLLCCLSIGSLSLLLPCQSQARYYWEYLVQPDWQTDFNDVYALPGIGRAWAVGGRGIIARTTDEGVTWSAQTSGTTHNLHAVHFVDPDDGWTVGAGGTILGSGDGGDTWSSQVSGVTGALYGVYFIDSDNGWTIGEAGTILSYQTATGWLSQTSGTTSTLYGVCFANYSDGWAVGEDSTILRTTDGGTTWTPQSSGLTDDLDLRDVDFNSGSTRGLIVGEKGTILLSTDSGANWAAVSSGTDQYLYGVDFYDGSYAWVAGGQTYDEGVILRSSDNGATWSPRVPVLSNRYRQMQGISFNSFSGGIAVGRYGIMLRTTNGDNPAWTWSQVTETSADLRGMDSPDGTNAWVCGSMGTVIRTTDRWGSWVEQDTDVYNELNAVSFPDQWNGWAVGNGRKPYQDVVSGEPSTVIRTADGGSSWVSQSLGSTVDENMYDVFMLDTSTGWICGGWGAVFHTTNEGSLWSLQDTDNDAYDESNVLFGIHFVDSSEGWACGYDGLMVHTEDSGTNWTAQTTDVDVDLYDVLMIKSGSDIYGWASGDEGTIIRTDDGGSTWDTITLPAGSSTYNLFGVDFIDNTRDGLAVGSEGSAYRAVDTGWSWEFQETVTSFNVYDVLMISDISAWAAAGWGEVLKYTDVSDTPALAAIKGQGAGLSDLNLYQYWTPALGDWTYWEAAARNPSPYYFARDLWKIPEGNDIVAAAPVDIDSDGSDEIAIVRNQSGDHNLYIYEAMGYGDTTYWDAIARNPSPIARDFWYIPAGNNITSIAGVKVEPLPTPTGTPGPSPGFRDKFAVLKNDWGVQKLYYYNVPTRGEVTWAQNFARNGLGPYAFDEWFVPRNNNILDMAGAEGTGGGGRDQLVTIENSGGDYNLYVWKAPAAAGIFIDEFRNRALQLGFQTPSNPVGFGNPQAQDLWIIPRRNDIVSITAVKADDASGQYPGNYDALGVMENYWGDRNFYLWKVPVRPEHTYTEAEVRQVGVGGLGEPQARDLWIIPGVPSGGSSPWILGLDGLGN